MSKLNVLFLCTGNSCRSQMAEGFALLLKSDVIKSYSAGTAPQGMNPLAVKVMGEVGVDISANQSKHVNELVDELINVPLDFVVTVCGHANETCPVFPGKTKVVHVGFDDPPKLAESARSEDEALVHYRRVRDEIRTFIESLPSSLNAVGES